ncbi:hypothetical protein P154DRAFT_579731 [Amniculicola lignicola CBS 123094]|uniref:Uncharacterized protein n=1 Tax=Amniculicola lignicola CBS 123094 TaxID=1392246 RepID=A0A6A5W421_9PLEO|nr:hypothetical protein P154DRAFT_579731 [Amniculicola lignicola CBS 123094]
MLPVPKSTSTARQPRKWTVAEDQKLREEVEAQLSEGEVKDWCRIAQSLPGRTNKDCRKRWHNSVAGGLKKGQWAKSEDQQLAGGVRRFGQRWTLVADVVGSRSADQCAKRWQQSLDPELDRSEWRDSEDKILIQAVQTLGRHWKDIQRHHFPGRSKNCIKNRYTVLLRRYQNQGISLPEGPPSQMPTTPEKRLSSQSTRDDDSGSYSSSVYDDLLATHTRVSTPETQSSWQLDEEPFTSWPSSESYAVTSGPLEFQNFQPQPPTSSVSSPAHWNWTTTSMEAPSIMNIGPPSAYPNNSLVPPTMAGFYGVMQGGMGHAAAPVSPVAPYSSFSRSSAGPPRSSPRSPDGHTPSYHAHDPEAVARFMKYGGQAEPPFRLM